MPNKPFAAFSPPVTAGTDGQSLADALDRDGYAILPNLLTPKQCTETVALYDKAQFRSHVIMARHGYGRGEYRYFAEPLPPLVQRLRAGLYPPLATIADDWHARLGNPVRFPATHADFRARCHAAGQTRPTPLLLRYGLGDYNCLHQDLYGERVFPLQVAILLDADFTGGEFILTEQRPRQQSRATIVPLTRGDAVVFPVNHRPVAGNRGTYRVAMRHGVSTIRSGRRHTLGIIFHDAT